MDFQSFLDQAWADHASKTSEVVQRFSEGIKLIGSSDDLVALGHLITHVMGEHLGDWKGGRTWLERISHSPHCSSTQSQQALARFHAVLSLAEGDAVAVAQFTPSEWIRVLTMAASCVLERGQAARASGFLKEAVRVSEAGLMDKDPAHRSLAIAGNNIASALEERSTRTDAEAELMVFAAGVARVNWEKAGTWLEVERAEYRLGKSWLAAGDVERAQQHAKRGLMICIQNNAPALEMFFFSELYTLIYHSAKDFDQMEESRRQAIDDFERLEASDKVWCQATLDNIVALKN